MHDRNTVNVLKQTLGECKKFPRKKCGIFVYVITYAFLGNGYETADHSVFLFMKKKLTPYLSCKFCVENANDCFFFKFDRCAAPSSFTMQPKTLRKTYLTNIQIV